MSLQLIKYFWENNVYSKEKMIELVKQKIISQKEFFEITRLHYKSLINK